MIQLKSTIPSWTSLEKTLIGWVKNGHISPEDAEAYMKESRHIEDKERAIFKINMIKKMKGLN